MFQSVMKGLAGAALVAAFGANVASAAPIPPATTVGADLSATGSPVDALFLFANAANDSDLHRTVNGVGPTFVFSNGGGNETPAGTEVSFVAGPGIPLVFTLTNSATGISYSTGVGSTNVAYIFNAGTIASVNAALGLTIPTSGATADKYNALLAKPGPLTIIAFEDRPLATSDLDFNDLVFAFATIQEVVVPAPAALGLFGLGLLGLGALTRGRRSA